MRRYLEGHLAWSKLVDTKLAVSATHHVHGTARQHHSKRRRRTSSASSHEVSDSSTPRGGHKRPRLGHGPPKPPPQSAKTAAAFWSQAEEAARVDAARAEAASTFSRRTHPSSATESWSHAHPSAFVQRSESRLAVGESARSSAVRARAVVAQPKQRPRGSNATLMDASTFFEGSHA